MKLRVGYSAAIVAFVGVLFVLASLELTLPFPRVTGVLPRILIWLAPLPIGIGVALAVRWLIPDRLLHKLADWRDYLENRPIPRFTFARVIVLIGVVAGECLLFFWSSDNEKHIKPLFVLFVCGLIISLNVLENSWVASDRRQGKTPRPSRSRYF